MMSNEVATDRQTTQYSTDASERSSSCRKSTKSSSASKGLVARFVCVVTFACFSHLVIATKNICVAANMYIVCVC